MDTNDLKNLSACPVCGAAVANMTKHQAWHEDRGEQFPERTGRGWFM